MHHRRFSRVLAIGASAVAGLAALLFAAFHTDPAPVSAITNCETDSAAIDAIEQAVLDLHNQARAQQGLKPLKISPALSRAAAWKSADKSGQSFAHFSHTDSLGRNHIQRARDCGYASSNVGENVAIGQQTAQAVHTAWMGSPGHRANILHAPYTVVGIGRVGPGWTVMFGTFDDSGAPQPTLPASTATPTKTSTPLPTVTPTQTSTPLPTVTPTRTPTPLPTLTPTPISTQLPQNAVALSGGFNFVTYAGQPRDTNSAITTIAPALVAVYRWDGQVWSRYVADAPSYASNLTLLRPGDALFIEVAQAVVWSY